MIAPLIGPICIPLLFSLVCLLLPSHWRPLRAWLVVLASVGTLLSVLRLHGVADQTLIVGDGFVLRVDALAVFVLLAAAVFAVLIAVYSLGTVDGQSGRRLYDCCFLASLAFCAGVILAGELILLVICWGMLAVTLYLMIVVAGPDASEAARKTLMIVGGSDSLLILGAALLYSHTESTRIDAGAVPMDSWTAGIALLCFLSAAFAKAGVVPLHSWVPDFGQRADAAVTAYLPASLDKLLGVYLLVRVTTDLFQADAGVNFLLMCFGSVTILSAAMMALVQRDLKRLLAYCAVAQVGYILLGLGTGTALGLAAALFHMLNHAIYKSCLFLGAGVVESKTGTVDLDRLGGLATRLPVTFAAFLVAALAVAGIPPLNGFASKWMIYQAVIESGANVGGILWVVWLVVAMMGSALTLALFVKALHAVFLCKPSPNVRDREISRASLPMVLPMVVLAGVCLVFGAFPLSIPIPMLIEPAIGESITIPGSWWATRASALLLVAFALGWGVYWVALRAGNLRHVPTFIGGEQMDEVRIPGVASGASRHVEVTGVDFFRTVEQMPGLRAVYRIAKTGSLDLYNFLGRASGRVTRLLQHVHTGLLPSYLCWFVLGLLAILLVMTKGGS